MRFPALRVVPGKESESRADGKTYDYGIFESSPIPLLQGRGSQGNVANFPPLGKGEEEHSGFFTSHSPAELGNAPISPSSAWAPLPLLHPRWHKCPAWARRRGKARCRRLKNRLSRFPACASFSSPHTEGAAASGLPPPRFPPLALPGI